MLAESDGAPEAGEDLASFEGVPLDCVLGLGGVPVDILPIAARYLAGNGTGVCFSGICHVVSLISILLR